MAAVVTISEIDLMGGANGKVVLMNTPVTTDLIQLAQSAAVLVDGAVVPDGQYSELRFVITGGYVEVDDGAGGSRIYSSAQDYSGLPAGATVFGDLQMPSLAQAGLKVDFDGSVDLNIAADQDLLVDFDVAQSFGHQAGNSGKWVMHPVIKGATASTAAMLVATLKLGTGVTRPAVGGNPVTLAAFKAKLGAETVDFTDPDGDGTFEARFRMLLPGSYDLDLEVPAGLTVTTTPTLPVTATVTASQTVTVAITIDSAT